MGNFSQGTRVPCNSIRCEQMGPSMKQVGVFLPLHCVFAICSSKPRRVSSFTLSFSPSCWLLPPGLCASSTRRAVSCGCANNPPCCKRLTALHEVLALKEKEKGFLNSTHPTLKIFFGSCFPCCSPTLLTKGLKVPAAHLGASCARIAVLQSAAFLMASGSFWLAL